MIMRTVGNQPRTTREDLVNDLKQLGPYSPRTQLTHYTVNDWNPAAPARSRCSRKHMYRPVWSLPMIQRRTGWKCRGQIRPKLSSLASTQLTSLEEEKCCLWSQEHHPHCQTADVETLCFGGSILLRRQNNCTASKVWWTGPGHWKWVMDGYFSI